MDLGRLSDYLLGDRELAGNFCNGQDVPEKPECQVT
jgi:hypothetical protein